MNKLGKNPLLLALFIAVFIYLLADFFVFQGPAKRGLESIFPIQTESLAARVCGYPITLSQLHRAVDERLWLAGTSATNLTSAELEIAQTAVLDELIEHEILRARIKAAEEPPSASSQEINERLQRFLARFETNGALEAAMKSQGIFSQDDLKNRLAARIQQEKFVEANIAPRVKVADGEAEKWFEKNQKTIANPERVEARHIFIPTLDHPPEEAKQKLDEALAALTEKKKDFATLAKELSEDPATKDSGGALGWMSYDRLPVDFAAPLFLLELNKPTLIRSRLGWHLAEVTARKAAEPRTFEQTKPEIVAALDTIKRRQAIADFRASLRQNEAKNIIIFHHMIRD
ncbi:MAG: peptidylprolyl isomerase [Luteolibacter sp.]